MTTPTAPTPRNPVAAHPVARRSPRRLTPMFQSQSLPLFHAFRA